MRKKEVPQKPLVGVAMFTYNYGKYLDEALDSLRAQTFQDFEVYLSDDASSDGFTPQKIKSLKYDKIAKKLLYKENLGVSARARQLYKMIDNRYLFVLCADDKVAPDFVKKTVDFLEKHPDYGAVSTDILEYKDNFEGEPFMTFHYDSKKMGFPHMLVRCNCLGSSLMRNQALREIDLSGGFTRYQDWDRYVSMIERGWKIGLVAEPLFMYRLHSNSLSHTATPQVEIDVFQKMLKKHAAAYEKYHQEVMVGLRGDYLEVLEGKNWLERQYDIHVQEVARLQKELDWAYTPPLKKVIIKLKRKLRR